MVVRRGVIAVLAVVAGVATAAVAEGQGQSRASRTVASGERTHPRVRPAEGRRGTAFTLSFTLRDAPGHQGFFAVEYRVQVTPPRRAGVACMSAQPPPIDSGAAGSVERIKLTPPARGWCRGTHRATVFLQRGPYCPPPVQGQTPTPCPQFATQELDTGEADFTVGPRAHRRG